MPAAQAERAVRHYAVRGAWHQREGAAVGAGTVADGDRCSCGSPLVRPDPAIPMVCAGSPVRALRCESSGVVVGGHYAPDWGPAAAQSNP